MGFLDRWYMQDFLFITLTYCNHISIWTWHNTSLHAFVKIILDSDVKPPPIVFVFENPYVYNAQIFFGYIIFVHSNLDITNLDVVNFAI